MGFKSAFLALTGLAAVASAQKKEVMNPGLDWDHIERSHLQYLRPTGSWRDYWGAGWIPKACKEIGQGRGLNPGDFTVFNVHYDDCQEPWIMCRHKNSPISEDKMVEIVGKMPVRMRGYLRQYIAVPPENNGIMALWYYPGDIVSTWWELNINTMIHEMSHGLDFMALQHIGSPFSETRTWIDNYNQDSRSVSGYAQTNWVENFAEIGIAAIFDRVVPNGLGGITGNWGQIFHQYATYQGYLGDTINPGGWCTYRIGNSDVVSMWNKKRADMGPKPDVSFKSNVTVVAFDAQKVGMTIHDDTLEHDHSA